MKPINPNDRVRVKLTDHGKRLIVKSTDDFNSMMQRNYPRSTFRARVPEWDDEGWINGQFHTIMGHLGDCWSGCELPFTEMKRIEP